MPSASSPTPPTRAPQPLTTARTFLPPHQPVRPIEPEIAPAERRPVMGAPLVQPAKRMRFDTLPSGTTGETRRPIHAFHPSDDDYLRRAALFPDHFPYQRPQRGGRAEHGQRTNHVMDFKLFNYLPRDQHLADFVNVALPLLPVIAHLENTLNDPSLSPWAAYQTATELHNRCAEVTNALHAYMQQARDTLWQMQRSISDTSDTDSDDELAGPSGPVAEVHLKYQALYQTVMELREATIEAEERWLCSGGRT